MVLHNFDAQELGGCGAHFHRARLVDLASCDGHLDDFDRIVPALLLPEQVGLPDRPAAALVMERALGQAEGVGKLLKGGAHLLGKTEITVASEVNDKAHLVGDVLA